MTKLSNADIIDKVSVLCSNALSVPLFTLETALSEREAIDLCGQYVYDHSAGLLLQLDVNGIDKSNYSGGGDSEQYLEERRTILQYLLTIIEEDVKEKHDEASKNCIDMLRKTKDTFNREFLNLLYLIILFDYDELYSNLCKPIATYIVKVLHEEFKESNQKVEEEV